MKMLGTFNLNREHVEVYVDEADSGCSGWFCIDPVSTKGDLLPARIVVGKGQGRTKFLSTLLHEAFEFCAHRNGHRYTCTKSSGQNTSDCQFSFDHQEMDRIMDAMADFLADLLPALDKKIKWNSR